MGLEEQFAGIVGSGNVMTGAAIDERYRTDITRSFHASPAYLVRPKSTAEVSAILRIASEHRIPVTVLGGLTGTVGGAIPVDGGIALSLERMNVVEEIDTAAMTMTVQAGCVLQVAQDQAAEKGAFLPLDLGARGSAMIGGVIGTNAGGNRVLRYGMMRDMVIGLEVVLADGTVVSSMTKMLKDNAGINWKHMMIGSEGTLGVVTRAVLRLRPLPTTNQTALVAFDSFDDAIRLLRRLEVALSGRLSSFELMWQDFYARMTEAQLARRPRPMPEKYPFYALLEALGGDEDGDQDQFERVLATQIESGLVRDAVIAQSERERDALWAVREEFDVILPRLRPFTVYDVSMSHGDMPRFVADTRQRVLAAFPQAVMLFYGHAGDGNLHLIVHVGPDGDKHAGTVEDMVYDCLGEVGGSVAAEHGIGLAKRKYLRKTRSDAEIVLMRKIKQALDPANILNPGKILGDSR